MLDGKPLLQDIKAIIVMGVSGSGKSTIGSALAQKLGFLFEDGDDFHSTANIEKMTAGLPLDDSDRLPWLKTIAQEIDVKVAAGRCIVVACSALKRTYRDLLLAGRPESTRIVYLRASREILQSRMMKRSEHFMPVPLLDSQLEVLEPPSPDEKPIEIDASRTTDQTVDSIIEALHHLPSSP